MQGDGALDHAESSGEMATGARDAVDQEGAQLARQRPQGSAREGTQIGWVIDQVEERILWWGRRLGIGLGGRSVTG